MMRFLIGLLLVLAALAQQPQKTDFEGQPGFVLANGALELTVLERGSTLASVVLADDAGKLSPLWNPTRMAREAGEKNVFDSATGHFVCVDGFGPVSAEEEAAGLPGHGEAHQAPFEVKYYGKQGHTTTLTLSTKLPLTQELFTRTIRMADGEDVIHEPEKEGLPHRLPSDKEFTWPEAPGLHTRKIDLRAAPAEPNSGDHTTCLMDPVRKLVFVTALHPGKRLLLGYLFKPQEYAWTQNWEYYPPNKKLARGLEFSTQPFDVPRREVVQLNSLFGSPVFRWLAARTKIESRFLMFYAHTPEGFSKVDDVRLENDKIIIEDHKAHKQVTLNASLPI